MVGAGAFELGLDAGDAQLEIVDQLEAGVNLAAPRLGDLEPASSRPPPSPNRSAIGTP
jgi:hypothetical protein